MDFRLDVRITNLIDIHFGQPVDRAFGRERDQPNYLTQIPSKLKVVVWFWHVGVLVAGLDGVELVVSIIPCQKQRQFGTVDVHMFGGEHDKLLPNVRLPPGCVELGGPEATLFILVLLEGLGPL